MKDGKGGFIAPGKFLPLCEESDLIYDIDRWVFAKAAELLRRKPTIGNKTYRLHVNLSRRTLSGDKWLSFVHHKLDKFKVDPSRIVVELTETATLENVHRAILFMKSLRKLGIRFALDDFGVGFSSLGTLRKLPVDYLKIDGSFIRGLPDDSINQHLVKAFVEMARGLGKQTVAEFVEDEATLRLLKEYGVEYGQGYYIGRPEPTITP